MDKDQLSELITQMCKLDVKRDGDEIDRLDNELKDKVVDKVQREYDHTVEDGKRVKEDLDKLVSEAQSARDRAHDLEGKDEVKSDAGRLREDVEKTQKEIKEKLIDRYNRDLATLDRVKEGSMKGANNPLIRARMEYGKEMHKKLQSDRSCDLMETVLSSGRPDCIKFDSDDCKVIEFKPDTYSTGAAEDQAKKYLNDVRDKFKGDDRAKKCKWDSAGPVFRAVGELYPACKVQ
jgi:Rad3-related DNA helicase